MKYSSPVQRYFFDNSHVIPSNVSMSEFLRAEKGSLEQGYIIKLLITVKEGIIQKAYFQAYASPILIAGLSFTCSWLIGKTIIQAQQLDFKYLSKSLALSSLQIHRILIIKHLLKDLLAQQS